MGGISNIQIEEALQKINDPDVSSNFVGVFPSNYMNKFINHAAMIENSGKFPFKLQIPTVAANLERTGRAYWI